MVVLDVAELEVKYVHLEVEFGTCMKCVVVLCIEHGCSVFFNKLGFVFFHLEVKDHSSFVSNKKIKKLEFEGRVERTK